MPAPPQGSGRQSSTFRGARSVAVRVPYKPHSSLLLPRSLCRRRILRWRHRRILALRRTEPLRPTRTLLRTLTRPSLPRQSADAARSPAATAARYRLCRRGCCEIGGGGVRTRRRGPGGSTPSIASAIMSSISSGTRSEIPFSNPPPSALQRQRIARRSLQRRPRLRTRTFGAPAALHAADAPAEASSPSPPGGRSFGVCIIRPSAINGFGRSNSKIFSIGIASRLPSSNCTQHQLRQNLPIDHPRIPLLRLHPRVPLRQLLPQAPHTSDPHTADNTSTARTAPKSSSDPASPSAPSPPASRSASAPLKTACNSNAARTFHNPPSAAPHRAPPPAASQSAYAAHAPNPAPASRKSIRCSDVK